MDLSNSSDESGDEEENFRNFDEEAKSIIETKTLPNKSADRYVLVYDTYMKWKTENKNLLSSSEENNLVVYFNQLIKKLKPSTVWSVWSMLKKTLSTRDNIDMSRFQRLRSIVKANAKGYKPTKSFIFKWQDILKFINNESDYVYLAAKVSFFIYFHYVKYYFAI